MSNQANTNDKVVLVTGASRGIGAAIAQELVGQGYKVIGTTTSQSGIDKIKSLHDKIEATVLDVNNNNAVQVLIKKILSDYGAIDILINNAGITRDQLFLRMQDKDIDEVLDTNLRAVLYLSRLVIRAMFKKRYGRIISVGSVVGAAGNPGQVNYAAAKAGLVGMTKALAKESGSRNITVNVVSPGYIETDMTKVLQETQKQALLATIPLGRLGSPKDIAQAVAFLASDQAAYITGQEIHVNGGMYV
jgi:3-oxoacyl-[acyl-carrier protein] reductase